ncbi:MAG: hypothetical protein V1799_14185 [bacterium]
MKKDIDDLYEVIIPDVKTHQMLAAGFMNREVLQRTIQEKSVTL